MKKLVITLILITFSLYTLFAANEPNIIIRGHLGEDLPSSIVLKVGGDDISGGYDNMGTDYDFSLVTTSKAKPVYAYIGNPASSGSVTFDMTVSTQGFLNFNDAALEGVGITMYTQALNIGNGITNTVLNLTEFLNPSQGIPNGTSNVYKKKIFSTSATSSPASFQYSVSSGAVANDQNFGLWFDWDSYDKVAAGSYTATIIFDIGINN